MLEVFRRHAQLQRIRNFRWIFYGELFFFIGGEGVFFLFLVLLFLMVFLFCFFLLGGFFFLFFLLFWGLLVLVCVNYKSGRFFLVLECFVFVFLRLFSD